MKAQALIVLVIAFSYACHTEKGKNQPSEKLVITDTITIDSASPIQAKLAYVSLDSQNYRSEFRTIGTVQAVDGKLAEITTPFSGRITRINVKLGQKIAAGGTICELSSPDYFDATKSYFQALSQHNQIEKQYKRQHDLVSHGVGSQKELEQAQADYESAKSTLEQEAARMQLFHADLKTLSVGQAFRVVSPIGGEVVKLHTVLGQYLKEDAEAIAIVANLSKVWVIAKVKEKYIGQIQKQDKAIVHSDAHPSEKIQGKIMHLGEIIDSESRCIDVIIECDNNARHLKPGMFTRVGFVGAKKTGIIIPSSAVLQAENQSYVLIKVGPNKFVKRMVQIESLEENKVVVTEGLTTKDTIVSGGGIYLIEE